MAQKKLISRAALISFASISLALAPASELGQLTGAANFRDIGGYQTSDGHKIKLHTIYRSGELSGLTASDQKALTALQIRYEIDLRTDKERRESPTRWGGHPPEVISISVGQPREGDAMRALGSTADLKNEVQARSRMQEATARIAVDGAADIGQALKRLAEGDEPALIHCTAGKDRTGVTVAVLMTLLQVPREQVYHEYLRSNEAVDQQLERANIREKAGISSGLPPMPREALLKFMGAEQSYLEAAFHAIDKEYGSFEAYTKNGLKLTSEQIQALRDKLLDQ